MSAATDSVLSSAIRIDRGPGKSTFLGVALTSFSALLLELGLTRLFSVVLFYHFAFLAISVALLGLGAGGVFAYLGKTFLSRFETGPLLARLSVLNAMLIPLVLELTLRTPVSLDLKWSNFFRLNVIYFSSALPFFLTGAAFSILFARETAHVTRLYGADLLGGALACLAMVPLLNFLGGPNVILFAAIVASLAALAWTPTNRSPAILVAVALCVLLLANRSGSLFDVVYAKGNFRDKSWVEFSRWNALSRVEVDRQGGAKAIVIDADASTYIMNADPAHWEGTWQKNLMAAPPAVANVLRPHGDYAIIGPGGGVDVLRAVANGSHSVTGIEINPIIANTIMRGRYADYAQHLYERPDVQIHVTDGRSYVRNCGRQFDVLQMTLVDTWASTAAGAFALSENNLYTVEAFREYFDHLRPDGFIAITRWEFHQPREALRVVSVAMQALHELGVADPARNFIVVAEGDLDEDGIPVAVLAKKTAFTPEEEQAVQQHLDDHPALVALYMPSQPTQNPFGSLIASNDPAGFARNYAYNVSPVYDNSPFFFFTLRAPQLWSPSTLRNGIDWKVNLGVLVLGMVLVISLLAVLAFLVVPLAIRSSATNPVSLLYFIAVGLGYILIEIAFIQRLVLFLGHPTYALTVVVFLLLLSSGAGSLVSRRWISGSGALRIALLVIAAAVGIYVFALPSLLHALIGLGFTSKLLVSAGILIPLGFCMGMPFPSGLRTLAASQPSTTAQAPVSGENAIEWAWALNAASSVLGSVLAIVIAMQFGLNATLACGATAYLLAVPLSRWLKAAS
jgi:hypothetical protein